MGDEKLNAALDAEREACARIAELSKKGTTGGREPKMTTLLLLMMFADRTYHPVAIEKMAANRHTHVEIVGFVTMVKREEDGDLHIRICTSPRTVGMDRGRCLVGEVIPCDGAQGLAPVKRGDRVRVRGISRLDREANHGWYELHPAEWLEVLR